jgi:hypothetical protein
MVLMPGQLCFYNAGPALSFLGGGNGTLDSTISD